MKMTKFYKLVAGALVGGLCLGSQTVSAQNWNLVWSDEFTNGIGSDWVLKPAMVAGETTNSNITDKKMLQYKTANW